MRYWKLTGSTRVIAVNCQMTPRWTEISKDEFEHIKSYQILMEKEKIVKGK